MEARAAPLEPDECRAELKHEEQPELAACMPGALTLQPLKWLLSLTCPECAHDAPGAARYPITLVASFFWVALFSTTIAAIVTRWGTMLRIPTATLGLCVIVSECPLRALCVPSACLLRAL